MVWVLGKFEFKVVACMLHVLEFTVMYKVHQPKLHYIYTYIVPVLLIDCFCFHTCRTTEFCETIVGTLQVCGEFAEVYMIMIIKSRD